MLWDKIVCWYCKVGFPAHPESTEHLVNEKLNFVFWEMTSNFRQVSEHVRHHQVAEKKKEREAERAIEWIEREGQYD